MASRSAFFRKFIESLYIRPKDQPNVVRFQFNDAQNIVWREVIAPALDERKAIRLIILKARQMGMSTLIQGLLAARFVWDNYVNEKVIAHASESTQHIWSMAQRMMDLSPLAPFVSKAGTTLELGTSHYSIATAGSPHATRSMTMTALHLSEVALWPHPEAWIAALQTVPMKGESWLFVESTANGKTEEGALFYDEWNRAQKGKNHLTPIFLPWFEMAEYELPNYVYAAEGAVGASVHGGMDALALDDLDYEEVELKKAFNLRAGQLAWRRFMIDGYCRGDVEQFHQEYPSTPEEAFIQSGLPLFASKDLIPMRKEIRSGKRFKIELDGKFTTDPDGYVEIWKAPEPGHTYIVGADTSMGFDDDQHSRSAAEVFDMETMEQVAEYDCASPTYVMARHLAVIGRRYNNALLAPEITASGGGGGRELLQYLLRDHTYFHIYRYKHIDHIKADPGRMWGWETNVKTRSRMINRIVEVVKERLCVIHSEALLTQLQSFGENDSGRYESLAGKDDLLFAFGIACAVWGEEHYHVDTTPEKKKLTREALQSVGVKTVNDPLADWDEAWEARFRNNQRGTANWLAM